MSRPEPGEPEPPLTPATRASWRAAIELFTQLEREGRWDGEACRQALGAFENVGHGRIARPLYMMGLVASRCGNTEGANQFFSRALEINPSLCEARVSLGLFDLENGRRDQARRTFAEAIRRDNRCAPGYVNLAILQSDVPSQRAEALANLRRALSVRADYLPALDRMALLYLAQGEESPRFLDLGEMVCRQAQMIAPRYAPIYNTWGLIDLAQGELTGAAAKFARAMELDPRLFEAHMNFAQLMLSRRAYADAARAFDHARELRPTSYDAALGLGVAQRALRHPDLAEQMYRAALAIDDDRPEAYFDLAVLYQEHRDGSVQSLDQALEYLRLFVEHARDRPQYASVVQDAVRWCPTERPRRRRSAPSCRPGRAQNILVARAYGGGAAAQRPAWVR